VTVADVAEPLIGSVIPPAGLLVTVYPVSALPPLLAGAVQDTTADALPAVAETLVGASGGMITLIVTVEKFVKESGNPSYE
jgi:hypothetical protein